MKSTHFGFAAILAVLCIACIAPSRSSTQETKAPAVRAVPPTGTYVCFGPDRVTSPFGPTNRVPFFTLRLETDGTYRVESAWTQPTQDGDLVVLRPEVDRGKWRWDPENRQFLLNPGDFIIDIRRLSSDKQHPNFLVCGAGFLEPKRSN